MVKFSIAPDSLRVVRERESHDGPRSCLSPCFSTARRGGWASECATNDQIAGILGSRPRRPSYIKKHRFPHRV